MIKMAGIARTMAGIAFSLIAATATNAQAPSTPPNNDDRPPYAVTDDTVLTVRPGPLITWRITRETLVNNDAAARQMAEQELESNEYFEELRVTEAVTLKADGRQLKVPPESITTRVKPTEFSDADSIDTDNRITTVRFPDLQPGDRIRYTAFWTETKRRTPGGISSVITASPSERYERYHITLDAPADMQFRTAISGFTAKREERDGRAILEWTLDPLPYQPAEKGSVARVDNGPYVLISSFPDWNAVGASFCQRAQPMTAVTPEIAKLAAEITEGKATPREQAEAIHKWITTNIRYISIVLGTGGTVPRPAPSVVTNRYGDCKDHTTLMRSLLAAKGITSEYALIRSGDPTYKPLQAPVMSFDHVIVYMPELDLYVDPTAKASAFGSLPDTFYDKYVLRCGAGPEANYTRIPSVQPEANASTTRADLTIAPDGTATGTVTANATGATIDELKALFDRADDKGSSVVMTERLQSLGVQGAADIAEKSIGTGSSAMVKASFTVQDSLLGSDNARTVMTGPTIMFKPFTRYGNVFETDRRSDFVCIPSSYAETVVYHLPPGWHPEDLPKDVTRNAGPASFSATYRFADRTLTVERLFIMRSQGSICPASLAKDIDPAISAALRDAQQRLTFVPDGDPNVVTSAQGTPAQATKAPLPVVELKRPPTIPSGKVQLKLRPGFLVDELQTVNILANTKEGAAELTQRSVTVDEFHDVEIIEAATLKADGRRLDVPADKIFNRSFGKNWEVRTILFPDVAEGDRILYTTRSIQKRAKTTGGVYLGASNYAHQPPDYTAMSLDAPASMRLQIAASGFEQKVTVNDDRVIYEWDPEPQTYKTYKIDELYVFKPTRHIEISTYPDWEAAAGAYCPAAEDAAQVTPAIAKFAEELTAGKTARLDQAKTIVAWVASNIIDTEQPMSTNAMRPGAPEKTLTQRKGSINDATALARALLAARGINAYYVLINTTGHRVEDNTLPTPLFSSVILHLPEFGAYVDTMSEHMPFGVLSDEQYGAQMLVCGPGKPVMTRMPSSTAEANNADVAAEVIVGADGKASGTVAITATGTNVRELKKFVVSVKEKGADVLIGKMREIGLSGSARLEPVSATDTEAGTVKMSFATTTSILTDDNAKMVIAGPRIASRPFRPYARALRHGRVEDFSCFPKSYREKIVYRLPDGWKPRNLPKDVTRIGGPAEFTARYRWSGNTVEIERTFAMRTTVSVCPAALTDTVLPVAKVAERDGGEFLTFVPIEQTEATR